MRTDKRGENQMKNKAKRKSGENLCFIIKFLMRFCAGAGKKFPFHLLPIALDAAD
jgi:hypothetical protein